jgi:succinoglycan biosynthesis transport protein ExoP
VELVAKLEETETKLADLPGIAREFDQLLLNNQQALDRYDEALQQLDAAKMAERLESGGRGQRLVLIGEPQIPAEPYQPIRAAILILVVVLGVGGGIVFATIVDTLDNTVKSSREILAITGAPALAVIPLLESAAERRVRTTKNVAVIGLLVASLVGAITVSQVLG